MAKNILTYPIEDFRKDVYKITFAQLKNVIEGIYEFKWNHRNLHLDLVMDLERKETIINAEMMRRGKLNPKLYHDYFMWLRKMNYKKRYF